MTLSNWADIQVDPALLGELDGIASQVDQNLPQMARVTVQVKRRLRCDMRRELQSLGMCLGCHHRADTIDQAMEIEIFLGGGNAAGFDARNIEYVFDQFQQGVGRCVNDLGIFLLRLVEPGFSQKVGHPDHAIEWGAQFMAHVGQEVGFGLAGVFFPLDSTMQLLEQAGGVEWHNENRQPYAPPQRRVRVPERVVLIDDNEPDCGCHR